MHRANSVRYVDQPQSATSDAANKHQHHQPPPPPTSSNNQAHQWSQMTQSPEVVSSTAEAPIETGSHQQQQQHPECTLKSYFSDGDFSEVLIKINDHDDQQQHQQQQRSSHQVNHEHAEAAAHVKRRRSSCSDAGDSKRSSLSHEQV